MNSKYLSEQERQAELLRLRREHLLAKKAGDFEHAALLIGLAERQQVEAKEKCVFYFSMVYMIHIHVTCLFAVLINFVW